jgi:SAM-dependent methyltransferase
MADGDPSPPTVDQLVDELQQRIEARRRDGTYPSDLEDALDAHFQRVMAHRGGFGIADVQARLAELSARSAFGRDHIQLTSRMPGGSAIHRAVGAAVSRQIDGTLQQMRDFADAVRDVLTAMVAVLDDPSGHVHADLVGQVDALFEQFGALERGPAGSDAAIADLRRRIDALEAAERRREFRPWFSNDSFEEAFRGSREELVAGYRGLAGRFHNCAPVLDIGCGRGEFLELLKDEGIPASGVEVDRDLVDECVRRELDVQLGDGLAVLRGHANGGLGGVAMIQVIEHLTPQQVTEFVALAYDKVRPGGRVVVETVNPQSLYVFAHSFYVDPTHEQPIHPAYLEFLFREAGFSEILIEWRSPPPDENVLDEPGDGGVNDANVRRLNNLLFNAQDYAVIATR